MPARTLVLTERVPRVCRLSPGDVAFLLREHPTHVELEPTGRRHRFRLTPAGVAGVLVAPGCRLVIRPKVPLQNLFYLLEPTAPWPAAADAVTPVTGTEMLNFLAGQFAHRLAERLAAGLHRGYVERAEEGPYLHGRLDLVAQLREAPGRKDRLHSRHDDLTADLPCNRALRTTAERLLRSPLVGEQVRAALGQLLPGLDSVGTLPPGLDALAALPGADRLPPPYGSLLDMCRLLLEGLQPGDAAGPASAPAFLLDMERVFERYLTRGVVAAFAGSARHAVAVQPAHTANEPAEGQPDLHLRPDLTIGRDGRPLLVVDAKWKRLPADALVTADVYQVLAYATALGAGHAVLVYPGRRRRSWAYRFPQTPVRLTVHTLNVAGPREACARSLRRLVGVLKRGAQGR